MKRIVVLGSTGSIGTQTVDVVRQHSDELEIVGLAVNTRVGDMLAQARAHNVRNLAVGDECLADQAIASEVREQAGARGVWGFGMDAVVDLVRLPEADVVVNALVGAAGLRASYETLRAGKVLALANKESLVVGGAGGCAAPRGGHGPCGWAGRCPHAHRLRARRHLPMPAGRIRARGLPLVGYGLRRPVPRQEACRS